MTTCTRLSDEMPAITLGRRDWTAEEARHLADCADCRAEWELLRASARLGAGEAWNVDAPAMARRALAQVTARRHEPRHYGRWLVSGIAAAAALVLLARVAPKSDSVRGSPPSTSSTAAVALDIPALDDLSADELRAVLAAVSGPSFDADAGLDLPELESLDSTELEQVLTDLEET